MNVETIYTIGRYIGAAFAIGFGAIGPAFGIGLAGSRACMSMARQPGSEGEILKIMLVGQAITESSSIFALLVALILLFTPSNEPSIVKAVAAISSGLCVGWGAIGPGIGAGLANAEACTGIGIQPKNGPAIFNTMLIGQAVSQSTSVYAMVVSFLLIYVI